MAKGAASLKAEFEYYLENQDRFVEDYDGKFIVIKGSEVIGAYDKAIEAVRAGEAQGHQIGTFLVQKVSLGDEDYTQTYHSRVAFV